MQKQAGFTLIELLVVVAIVAILAAIAVPNFMEAQVRAKVSRAKSDMRSLATSIEAYCVDFNNPPWGLLARNCAGLGGGDASIPTTLLYPLTTPTPYFGKLPRDPFISGGFRVGSNTFQKPTMENTVYWYDSPCLLTMRPGFTKSGWPVVNAKYCAYNDNSIGSTGGQQDSWNALFDMRNRGYKWLLVSTGPEKIRESTYGYTNTLSSPAIVYDPTNGTLSKGNIVRTNRGQIPVEPFFEITDNAGSSAPYRSVKFTSWFKISPAAPDDGWR